MDRTIINPLEQMRSFDFVMFEHDVLVGLGSLIQDIFSGMSVSSVVAGFGVTARSPASLTIALGAGRIYSLAFSDATSVGSIPQDVSGLIGVQGEAAAQNITLTPPAAGQSQWNLIQVQFSPVDTIRPGDPNNGTVPFYNSDNPAVPNQASIATVRQHKAVLQVIQGAAATTGSEVPPLPTSGWTPLYLIDLAGGQSAISAGQALVAGPGVGTNVPGTYPIAPFLAGFLASHHTGKPGAAPKINLTNEVTGILPSANLPPNVLTGSFPAVRQLLTSNLTLFVNSTTGNDTNNGLTSGAPFRTIQAAINSVMFGYDFNGKTCTINVANGTYAPIRVSGTPLGMSGALSIIGNAATPASCVIAATGDTNAVQADAFAVLFIRGFAVSSTGGIGAGIIGFGAQISFDSMQFGNSGNAQIAASNGSQVVASGTYTIVASTTPIHAFADAGGIVNLNNITASISGTVTVTNAFAVATRNGTLQARGAGFAGGIVNGPRYLAGVNGVIDTAGGGANYFPGSSAGIVLTGGQYV